MLCPPLADRPSAPKDEEDEMSVVLSNEITEKVASAFNFSINKFPLSGPDGMRTPWYALFRSDSGEVVGTGSVTSRYQPHNTDDVIALVEASAAAFEGVADVQCHFRNAHYVAIQPTVEYRKAVFGTADNVYPRCIINFPYTMEACRVSMGYFRDLCRNMHIMRSVRGTTVRIRHDANLRHHMDDLVKTFGVLKESWGSLSAVIENMEARRVNMVDFLNAMYGEPDEAGGRAVTIHKHRTEAIFRRLTSERFRSGRPSLGTDWMVSGWEAFNAVQGYVQHEASRRSRQTPMDRLMLSSADPAVIRAERLIAELAV
jgi:hypothetical protein